MFTVYDGTDQTYARQLYRSLVAALPTQASVRITAVNDGTWLVGTDIDWAYDCGGSAKVIRLAEAFNRGWNARQA